MSDPIRALMFYADFENWRMDADDRSAIRQAAHVDGGDRARRALAAYRWADAPTGEGFHWCVLGPSKPFVTFVSADLAADPWPDTRWYPVLPPPEDD